MTEEEKDILIEKFKKAIGCLANKVIILEQKLRATQKENDRLKEKRVYELSTTSTI